MVSFVNLSETTTKKSTITIVLCVHVFQIFNAQVTDTGRYACVAENVAGSAEKYFSLNVHGEVFTSSVIHPATESISLQQHIKNGLKSVLSHCN